ncbi:winged helix-turn-helix transcriptional regulator [Sphingomonas daechungensis]|uniref:Winged helix-turn-helix transcriptional regulator n=1 Tax=Sphingomonas daechungensis TaxID=1176646 RepID=A0ABX6T4R3_9SPHN|nr:winged helix-turn-helix domain-containing protein [Sphingomonas daechungensis]QNP43703.1 winged helix-turn-helix transcriptional regulator [Sphingomonas daechungensis]
MAEETLSARLVEIESMLERSRRRFEEGTRLVEEAQQIMGEIQQALIGAPTRVSPEDSDEAASKLLQSLKATGGEMPESLCGGRLSVDQVQRLIRIDGHPIGITEMEYRVLELLAFARNNVVTRAMLLKHLYRRADDQPQPKIIDVFISKLRKKLRSASGGRSSSRRSPNVAGSSATSTPTRGLALVLLRRQEPSSPSSHKLGSCLRRSAHAFTLS